MATYWLGAPVQDVLKLVDHYLAEQWVDWRVPVTPRYSLASPTTLNPSEQRRATWNVASARTTSLILSTSTDLCGPTAGNDCPGTTWDRAACASGAFPFYASGIV